MRTRIKICGVTDPDTAGIAVAAGADAIGLIFHPPSKRHLELAQAAAICRAVAPFVSTVAVMVNPTAESVRAIVEQVEPDCLQFHGEESPDFCGGFGRRYRKAVRMAPGVDWRETARRHSSARGILLDTHEDEQYGGTGATFDWGRVRCGGKLHLPPLILAGGLRLENIAEALAQVRPFGVDVSSGVERDGRKDAELIRRFCREVNKPH